MSYKNKERQNEWRRRHPEISRRWRRNHRKQSRKIQLEDTAQRRYGISRKEQERLHKLPCEICGCKAKKMCIDHVVPGTYRGVLCQQCNTRLGWFEKLRNIILNYVKRGPHASSKQSSKNRHGHRGACARKT